jgi:chromosome segregation protein
MYLKSLHIHGFKSFAQKTVFEFLPPKKKQHSVTVVVGPNGSGKSNVSDAIRWVMGEQRLSQIRGKKSEDVIFSGSDAKSQMGYALVTMTLDNADARVPIDQEELVISRKVYRSGESEYRVNNRAVRLLDLQLLLAKAQFGQGSYAVIGQGMIDRLLLQSSAERKMFFDEATGIKEFQLKRHQASLRLARTQENIDQADRLLQEMAPHMKLLSRQVKRLEQRQQVEQELLQVQQRYYRTLWDHFQEQEKELHTQISSLDTTLEKEQAQLLGIQKELSLLARESSRQDVFASLQHTYQTAVQQVNAKERERAVLQAKLETEYIKSGDHQTGWLETKVQELSERQTALSAQIDAVDRRCAGAQEAVAVGEKEVDDLRLSKTALQTEVAALESQLLQQKTDQASLHVTGFRAVKAVLDARTRVRGVHGIVSQLGSCKSEHITALDVAAGGRLASVIVDTEDTARACIDMLRKDKLGVATFLPLSKIRAKDVPAFIADMVKHKGIIGFAKDLIKTDQKYSDIFSFVFGATLVVEDFDIAKKIGIGKVRMVTLAGDLFETSGAVKGGFRTTTHHGLSFGSAGGGHSFVEQIKATEDRVVAVKHDLDDVEKSLDTAKETLQKHTASLDLDRSKKEIVLDQKQVIDTEYASLERELSMKTMSPQEVSEARKDMSRQKARLEKDIEKGQKSLTHAQQDIERFNEEEEKKKQRVFALQSTMQQQQAAVSGYRDQKNEKAVLLAKIETKLEDLRNDIYSQMRVSIDVLLGLTIDPIPQDQLEQTMSVIEKLKYKRNMIGGIDDEIIEEYQQTKMRYDELLTQLADLNAAVADLTKVVSELDSVMKQKRNAAFKQIKREFQRYFKLLFEGGKADVVEVFGSEDESSGQSDDGADGEVVYEPSKKSRKKILTGIDIAACPPGKKIKHIQSLSGGERTLTSIALMCAILKTNPSPFVVLDEVEAALDEANTLRVAEIIKELSTASQFVIITHNPVTMYSADALYGVSMGGDGISQVLSVEMTP